MTAKKDERPITNKTSVTRLGLSGALIEALLADRLGTLGAVKKALKDPGRVARTRAAIRTYAKTREERDSLLSLAERVSSIPPEDQPSP
jgi:hypothetical protein